MAKKTFSFFFDGNIDPKYKTWAREAVEEFINLFPELKNHFEINEEKEKSVFTFQELQQRKGNLTDQDFQNVLSNFFEKQADGTFLDKSSNKYILNQSTSNGFVDLSKWWDIKQENLIKQGIINKNKTISTEKQASLPVTICLSDKKPANNFAISSVDAVCIPVGNLDKNYFKRIITHELGHSCGMDQHGQTNTNNLGRHCTDADCLGSELGPAHQGACFCEHCIGAIRGCLQYLKEENTNQQNRTDSQTNTPNEQDLLSGLSNEEKTFLKDYLDYIRSSGIHRSPEDLLWDRVYLLERFRSEHRNSNVNTETLKQEFKTVADTFDWNKEKYKNKLTPKTRRKLETFLSQRREQSIEVNNEPLPPSVEKESSSFYKMQLRKILQDSAKKENLEYNEEPRKQGYKAELKAADGSKTTIEATAQKVSLMAHNPKGEKVTPPFRRFMDIVSYAQQRRSTVSFGEIKTPEFKANLMIACLKAQPPVRMKGAPKMTEEFLNSLDSTTAKLLHEAYYSRKIEKELPTYEGLKRSQAERYLALKSKTGNQSRREWAELFYLEDQLVGDIALKEAEEHFGSPRPREAEWHQKTGFEPQRVVHYEDKRPGDASWKLHLDVTPNPDEPTTKAITEYLQKLDMDYKICGGEENGKGITVYVGSYQDITDLSTRLQMEFGNKVKLPARYTDQFNQEMEFQHVATGRFMIAANYDPKTKTETPVFDEVYPTTVRGISPARLEEHNSTGFLIKTAKKMKLVPDQTPEDYKQITDAKQHYDTDTLENYVSHRLYAKYLGAFYYGENAERFEKHLFNDKLPEAKSPERKKWDILANKYEQFIKDNCPEKIDLMIKHTEGYKPIDFTKENTNQNVSQQNNSTLTQQIITARQKTNC